MAGNDRPILVSPSASYGVEVGAADAASDNLDVDVAVAEGLGPELRVADTVRLFGVITGLPMVVPYLMPLGLIPFISRVDGKTFEGVRVHDVSCMGLFCVGRISLRRAAQKRVFN